MTELDRTQKRNRKEEVAAAFPEEGLQFLWGNWESLRSQLLCPGWDLLLVNGERSWWPWHCFSHFLLWEVQGLLHEKFSIVFMFEIKWNI